MIHPSAVTGMDGVTGTGTAADAIAGAGEPVIRVLRGNPDPAELAALVVALRLASRKAHKAVPGTADGKGQHRPGWLYGHRGYQAPGSWARHGTAVNW